MGRGVVKWYLHVHTTSEDTILICLVPAYYFFHRIRPQCIFWSSRMLEETISGLTTPEQPSHRPHPAKRSARSPPSQSALMTCIHSRFASNKSSSHPRRNEHIPRPSHPAVHLWTDIEIHIPCGRHSELAYAVSHIHLPPPATDSADERQMLLR